MSNFFFRFTITAVLFSTYYSGSSQNNFWKDVPESKIAVANKQRKIVPQKYRTLSLDTGRLTSFLKTTPIEFSEAAKRNNVVITLPMPDGSFSRFRIVETSMMEPGLAAQFPGIKTYNGQGIDDPYATIKIDWSERGFHGMVRSPVNGSVYIDPYVEEKLTEYISYFKRDVKPKKPFIENGRIVSEDILEKNLLSRRPQESECVGGTLRVYRLAVACTGEYANAVGGATTTTTKTLAAIVTTVHRVNGIYESELAIRLVLVNNNNKIVYINSAEDPFEGNDNAEVLIVESQSTVDRVIGANNYDVGHTLSTGSGGLAEVGVVCLDGSKASGVTGTTPPTGDPFDIDYVAHELGHEFGGMHTFNAGTGNCKDNEDLASNAEPGSGSSIMAYAGICDRSNDLQPNSDPHFHAVSFDIINDYVTNREGSICAKKIPTGNAPPVVNAGDDHVIPKSTPFVLTGSATDANQDALTYSWEQVNVGGPATDWNAPEGDAPIFRSFKPVTTPVRYFPKETDILTNTTTIGEILPSYSRVLQFRLTTRDNRVGGGGVCFDEMAVAVDGNSGPFIVRQPDTAAWDVSTFRQITWSVNKTNIAPVNCANVAIELSIDGGESFPVILLASTPNDGAEEIIVPDNVTDKARIRIRAIGNIFFDVSDNNFRIRPFTFTAVKDANNTIDVSWTTSNEIEDSLSYEIERSIDGVNFETIGKISAGSNRDSLEQYFFNDNKPYQGVNYYRLKQILDETGRFIYSKIVSVVMDETSVQYTVYPNPAIDKSTIRVLADMKEVNVRLIDVLGQQVFLKSFSTLSIGQEIQIPLRGLGRGVYFLTVSSDVGISTRKIMVQ